VTELLSVVLPTHNRPERLRRAAHSILSQDYPSIELIVVDDGSTASTTSALDELTAQDGRVVVVRHEQAVGSAMARNAGLAVAGGELVAFCDDDDLWLPGAAGVAVAASRPSTAVVYGWHQVQHESTGRCVTFRAPAECSPSVMRWINVPSILSGVVRRSVVGDALHFDAALYTSEDWDLWLRCADIGPMTLVPTPLYQYVQHTEERVTRGSNDQDQSHQHFLEKHRSSMSSACIAHHELTIALATRNRKAGGEQLGAIVAHPATAGSAALLAGELLANRVGRSREDPGLPLRFAARALSPVGGRPRRRTHGGGLLRPGAGGLGRPPIGTIWGWAQIVAARNATRSLLSGGALVLSPHPDDEAIGCGLLMAEKAQRGIPIAVAVATDGGGGWYSSRPRPAPDDIIEIRHGEWHRALDALGVPRAGRFELGFCDGGLADHEDQVADRIGDVLRSVRPAQVFVTRPEDPHPDHRALARATRRALAQTYDAGSAPRPVGPRPEVFTYRVYPGEGLWPGGRPADVTAGASLVQLARSILGLPGRRPLGFRAPGSTSAKVAAVEAHDSQRKLLDGELRYVWGKDIELYWPMDGDRSG
jgi:LmbE family N-acetylglucosaminyl deacetylase